MTAEVAVMNKQGLALAADSAVSFGGEGDAKIVTSANKIFALSKYRPVAIMIYGNAELLGVPWETIIKAYRRQLAEREFATVDEYAENFVHWVGANQWLYAASVQEEYVGDIARETFDHIVRVVVETVTEAFDAGKTIDHDEVQRLVSHQVGFMHGLWCEQPPLPFASGEQEAKVRDRLARRIARDRAKAFENLPLSDQDRDRLDELGVLMVTREPPYRIPNVTGVVIAGFGGDQLYPSFSEVLVDGVAGDELVAWRGRSHQITRADASYVGAFAQYEMVARFMEGVDPAYQRMLDRSMDEILRGFGDAVAKKLGRRMTGKLRSELAEARKAMLQTYVEELQRHRVDSYVDGVLSVVSALPVGELAHMAESLVNLTSFKRRVSMESETVSGPIDVAVISLGDGFIWIKRKHYFEQDRNPHFLANYYRES